MGHVTLTTPTRDSLSFKLAIDIILYLHTKFGNSRSSRSEDMIVGVKIENKSMGHFDPDHDGFGDGLLSISEDMMYKI